jgi:hypothetical protein
MVFWIDLLWYKAVIDDQGFTGCQNHKEYEGPALFGIRWQYQDCKLQKAFAADHL